MKEDERIGTIIHPPVPERLSSYFYLHNTTLNKCIRALAEDITLGEVTCNDENIAGFWKNNQQELKRLTQQWLIYGYAAAELIYKPETQGELLCIRQIPSDTIHLEKHNDSYYAVQNFNGNVVRLHIHGEVYPDPDPVGVDGDCIWIGGDEMYEHFGIPQWYSAKNNLIINNLIKEVNQENFESGNLATGLLAISGSRRLALEDEETFEESVERQFQEGGNGLVIAYVENGDMENPLNFEYINLSQSNDTYLADTYKQNEQEIFECFFMPKERVLNNETKESMNSNKSEILWNIYLRSCRNIQTTPLALCREINSFFFEYDEDDFDISLPTFEDMTTTAIENVTRLLELGLMSRKEAVQYLNDNLDFNLEPPEDSLNNLKVPLGNLNGVG